MHIPDGYLSPETCLAMYGAAAPFWYRASRRVSTLLSGKAAPMIAIFAAFSFTIQMFNVPVPPGTTAHAVGGTLAAIVLGPSAAIIAVSVALAIQALFFGDGGVLTFGANAFNMAIALPLSGYLVYSLLARGAPSNRRRIVAATLGSYFGINVAGMLVALELGLQPLLWSDAGRALYNPYGLTATVPAMALTHLSVAGFAEAAFTGLALSYILRMNPQALAKQGETTGAKSRGLPVPKALIAALAAAVLLVPLGLLATGSASFEWAPAQLRDLVGYVPAGMATLNGVWSAPLAGYQLAGTGGTLAATAPAYALSALLGVLMICLAILLTARLAGRARGSRRGGTGALSKTFSALVSTMEHSLFREELARAPGFLQQGDPRAKIVFTLLVLAAVSLARSAEVLVAAYALVLTLAVLSGVPLDVFVRRVWLGIPLFALLIALPTIFTIPGRPILVLADLGTLRLAITDNGLAGAFSFMIRVGTLVSLVTLLILTTRWSTLLKALRAIHFPGTFLVVLGMTYRYLFLFLRLAGNLVLARQSRNVAATSSSEQRRWVASATATMFAKSLKMSTDVHQAMLARGFTGELRSLGEFRMVLADWLIVALGVLSSSAIFLADRRLF